MKVSPRLGFIAATVLLLLASCARATPTPTPAPAVTPAPTPIAVQPKYGGVLKLSGRTDPAHHDPHYTRGWIYLPLAGSIFNGLIRWDPFDPNRMIPELAERYESSADGKTITFYLRRGVKWHDGQPFTAADVKFSLERLADPKRSVEASGPLRVIQSVDIVDDYTVRVALKSPSASLFSILASGAGVIQAQHIADKYERTDTKRLVGTGPFKFKQYIPGVMMEVVKNPDYWEKGKPYLDGIQAYVVKEEEAQIAALVGKRVDMTHPYLGVRTWPMATEFRKYPELIIEAGPVPTANGFFGQLREGHPWNDKRVRQAFHLVLDREPLGAAFAGSTQWAAVGGFLPAGSPYAVPKAELDKWLWLDKPYEQRVAEAKRLMQEAGYGSGFKARLISDNSADYLRTASVAADFLKRHLNVEMTIEPLTDAVKQERLNKRDYELAIESSSSLGGDPSETFGTYYLTGASSNFSGYSNPQLDELYDKQEAQFDPAKRAEITRQMERILMNDYVYITALWRFQGYAKWSYVKGEIHKRIGLSNNRYADTWLDK